METRYREIEEYWAEVEERKSKSICVPLTGFDHLVKKTNHRYPDTFDWVISPEIEEFLSRHEIPAFVMRSSEDPKLTKFYFPKDKSDIAALFKLRWGGKP